MSCRMDWESGGELYIMRFEGASPTESAHSEKLASTTSVVVIFMCNIILNPQSRESYPVSLLFRQPKAKAS